jgi:lysophospholipase L1-like esterase
MNLQPATRGAVVCRRGLFLWGAASLLAAACSNGTGGDHPVGGASGSRTATGGHGGSTGVGGASATSSATWGSGGLAAGGGGGSSFNGGAGGVEAAGTGGAAGMGGSAGGGTLSGGTTTVGSSAAGGTAGSGGITTAGGSAGGSRAGGSSGSTGGAGAGGTGATADGGADADGADAGGADAAETYRPCPTTPGTACVVLPLGDSITWGYLAPWAATNGGYRVELFRQAVLANKNITFVGSQTNGPDTVQSKPFPKANEGRPGYTIETAGDHPGIAGQITDSAISQGHPNIVLLMIGTNDVNLGLDLAKAPNRLGKLIDEIVTDAPKALVVVSNILPFADAKFAEAVSTYNAAIPGVVAARVADGKHVVFFDSYTAFSKVPNYATSNMSDYVHPNDAGYAVMGKAFYDAISGVLP